MADRKLLNIELGRLTPEEYKKREGSGICLILDNIRSAYNVGSAFRTADAFGADKIYLCGICATPPSAQIHKTALGAEESVEWESTEDTLELVKKLKQEGWTIVSAEQTEKAVSLEKFTPTESKKYAIVFGNEVEGVQQCVVDESDICLEIPQQGTKHSLNVSVSVGVVLWQFVNKSKSVTHRK